MSKKLMRIIALTMIVLLLPSTALAKTPSPKGDEITKAEFIAIISDFFAWPHPTEYNDVWKAPLKQFNDVETSDQYGKQIEVAYEEGIIEPDSNGNFNPDCGITREDAAVVFVKAFKIALSEIETTFKDKDSISEEALGSVNALVELGYMDGRTSKLFMPNELIKKEEVNRIFNNITTSMVAPVQALPKQTTLEIDLSEDLNIAPRRFVKLYTPTDGAKIYYEKASSTEGWPDVEDPTIDSDEYVLAVNGHISELVGLRSGELTAPDNYVVYKAIAVKDGKVSPVQTFRWHLYRPMNGPFQYQQIKEKTATSPAVYEIFRDNESVRAMAWYIEGEDSGIVFDALQTPVNVENLKDFIDENIATKPYISIIGHEHGDHDAQIPNFLDGDIDVYLNQRGWASVGKPGFGGVVTTPEAQAKVKNVEEGDSFDLGGGTVFEVYALPGHANGNVALYDRQSGYLFSSDFYGCTRAGSADTVGISGVRADLLLSFVQQVYSKYTKGDSEVNALFTGHDESELSDNNLKLFEAALQQVIDNGEDGCTPSVRGSNNRTTMIGDMYKDGTNWIALELGGKMGDEKEYLSSAEDISSLPYMEAAKNAGLNYNAGGHVKYSVLSNIEIEGGELVGKTVQWAKDADPFQWAGEEIIVNPSLENRFNPWSYEYKIIVPEENDEITIIPTTMSTKVKSIRINGKKVDYRSENTVKVSDGTVITVDITAPDKVTTSTYNFTVEKKTGLELQNANSLNAGDIPDAEKYLQGNRLPYTGYFEQQFTTLTDINEAVNGREVRVYIPENARLREYFVVLALPSGQDVDNFLETSGWNVLADTYNVGLLILLPENYSNDPSSATWGNYDDEKEYVDYIVNRAGSARAWYSTFSTYYFAGYGDGGAILQQWAANNPMFVISQAYIDVDEDNLDPTVLVSAGDRYYNRDGSQNTNVDSDTPQTDKTFRSVQKKEISIPTLLIGEGMDDTDAIAQYWLDVNECDEAKGSWIGSNGTVYEEFLQDKTNSSAIATSFSDVQSKVLLLDDDSVDLAKDYDVEDIYEFLSTYTRYDNSSSLGNALANRVNYSYDSDGPNVFIRDYETETLKSEYLVYIPDEAKDGRWGTDGAPVVYLFPGGSQPSHLFFDSTGWADVAQKHGIVIVNPCGRVQSGANMSGENIKLNGDGGVVARWSQAAPQEEYQMILEIMDSVETEFANVIDPNRVFGTGQSTGGGFVTYLSYENPDLFTAFGSTSPNVFKAFTDSSVHPGKAPVYFIVNDYEETGMGNNARNYWRNRNGFESTDEGEIIWPFGLPLNTNNDINYIVENSERYNNEDPTRYTKRVWYDNSDDSFSGLPMINSLMCYGRAHNNVVSDAFMQWEDWFSKWDRDENGNRVYTKKTELKAINFDEVEEPTTFDTSKANQLPLTGYFEKTLPINEVSRTAKVYIPEGTPVRAYYTVIAVAEGMDTEEFLVESGWKALADERKEGLFILEPGNEGWGKYEEEQAYITAAINFFSSNKYFSIFGEHYFVGYGDGAPVLEAWAAANPLKVISQVYVESEGLAEGYFDQFSEKEFGGANGNYAVIEFPDGFEKITYDEVLLPTWYINPVSGYSNSFDYWKKTNDCDDISINNDELGVVYSQKSNSKSWMTSHSGAISKVALLNEDDFDEVGTADRIYDFLSYYTRYENSVAYGNQLSIRADYDKLNIEIRTMEVEGVLREYMVYVPENSEEIWGEKAPVVVVFPGNSQTDKVFLDATQWWQVAEEEGFVLAIICEQNNIPAATTVSHKNSKVFYEQLREVLLEDYNVDATRFYSTGQSAGSMLTQSMAIALPEYFAAVASTSGGAAPNESDQVRIDNIYYDASERFIPNYFIYGAGDLTSLSGTLWDETTNTLDNWAKYNLELNEFKLCDEEDYEVSGWMDRFKTWTWSKKIKGKEVEFVKLTQNIYRSHNCISEEMPMLWDFMKHYSCEVDEDNNVTRYYSESGFVEEGDKIEIKKAEIKTIEPSVDNIKSIQAYTDLTFYGQKLTKVEIKYNGNVDLSGVTSDTYTLLDRGYSNPDFAEITIDSVDIKDKTVTLNITQDTEALPGNALIYSGDNAIGSRAKNPIGLYATGPWYRDINGVIYYGSVDTDNYKAKTNNEGYQTRECLELKLYHAGENEDDAVCLANEDGSYNVDGLWLPTIDANYGKRGFQTFEELGINVPTTATDGEKYVRGFAYFPKGYDKERSEKYPMIITITGNGTSFWLLPDGTNNFGTGLNFDGSAFRWMDCDAIVLNIHDRSHTGGDDYKFWEDDYNVIQHFIENYNADPNAITLTGNSRGTMAIGRIYQEYPGIANTLIINNGSMGSRWTEVDWQNAAHYGTSIWAFDGEQDTNNIEAYETAISYYKAAGWSDEWIAENIRLSGFPTNLYHYWGETDHSTTKMTYWYFYDNPYFGPDAEIVNGELVYNSKLGVGDTYELNGKLSGGVYNKEGFDYIIYGETLRDWVLSRDYETR